MVITRGTAMNALGKLAILLTVLFLGCGVHPQWASDAFTTLKGDKAYTRKAVNALADGAILHPALIDDETLTAAMKADEDFKLEWAKTYDAVHERDLLLTLKGFRAMSLDVKIIKAAETKATQVVLPTVTLPKNVRFVPVPGIVYKAEEDKK